MKRSTKIRILHWVQKLLKLDTTGFQIPTIAFEKKQVVKEYYSYTFHKDEPLLDTVEEKALQNYIGHRLIENFLETHPIKIEREPYPPLTGMEKKMVEDYAKKGQPIPDRREFTRVTAKLLFIVDKE